MRYPQFVAEMAHEANRPRFLLGIWSGYALAVAFGGVAILCQLLGVVPWSWSLWVIIFAKVVTNSLAWLALRSDRWLMPVSAMNSAADAFLMTAAIYVTGGLGSPLFVLYVLLVTVLALLTNKGVTIAMACLCVALYTLMVVATHLGLLTQHPSPIAVDVFRGSHVVAGVFFAGLVLTLTTAYTTAILRELRDKQRQLERRTDELVEASRQRSQFMANITHELRTPIHGITAVSELVESEIYGPVTDKQREAQRSIRKSALHLLEQVDELLLLAKSEAGKLELTPTEVNIVELTGHVVAAVRWFSDVKSQTLIATVPDDVPNTVTDRGKLTQVLMNLLANAIKFTPEEGTVELSVQAVGDAIVFAVRDTGVGIPPAEVDRVFEVFYQVDGTDERRHGGVGLGLALVKRLCNVIGARVSVSSEVGVGSVFTVEVPRVEVVPPAA